LLEEEYRFFGAKILRKPRPLAGWQKILNKPHYEYGYPFGG
jgi:hypothetical protein